ncbi:MAG: NAD(P)/FAD-dependent oxidoreductase [Longimonas sp.]|uniref:NAD(P)/FAD-dependent oxidoreductase n=1 Tax=Longimonas sp. TaxID=2039626 RepID=UPI0039752BAC
MTMPVNGSSSNGSAPPESPAGAPPHVVIIGAGFGGLHAAQALRRSPVEVTLVDRNNYHKFQPLLYEVAMAGLEPDDIAHNVRDIFRNDDNIRFRMGTVTDIDTQSQRIELDNGFIAYDYLVVAGGAEVNYFGVEGAAEHAFPLKNVTDAVSLRHHTLRQFERYDRLRLESPDTIPDGMLNFVLVGGGPTGVEMGGALVELFDTLNRDYPDFDVREQARVILLEMQDALLQGYDDSLQDYTRRTLEDRGVDVRTGTTVNQVASDAVTLADGLRIPTQTLIWAAGVQASPLADLLHAEQVRSGQVIVSDTLALPTHDNVFVVGDMAAMERDETSDWLPQVAQVAIQSGEHAAEQIRKDVQGRTRTAFSYSDYGQMATIGRNAAVAELAGGLKFKGIIAWLMWVVIHIAKLVGFRNRASVFMDWIYNYFTYKRHARLILDSEHAPKEAESPAAPVA